MAPPASLPENEADRLQALRRLKILDTGTETRFERITRMACWRFKVPMSLVSLVDEDRQWFKSHQGLNACETSRDYSFCAHAIHHDELFIVQNTLLDLRFSDNPLVTGEPYIRFYAAYPLKDKDGYRLGTFCIIDTAPRTISREECAQLRELGEFVEYELNRQKKQEEDAE
jgi:GAF domain-containing protein